MYPTLLTIGPVTIFSLWIFLTLGFLTALLVLSKLVKKNKLKMQFIADYSLAIFIAGIVMARIIFVIRNYDYYFKTIDLNSIFQLFYIWDRGLSIWGGLIGITAALLFFSIKNEENTLKWLDVYVTSVLSAFIFSNIGALLDGRNYGNETNLPWGIVIENSIYAVPIHPVQIYEMLFCLILTIVLYRLFSTNLGKKDGFIANIGIMAYSGYRFLQEFMRGDESNIIFGLREAQIYAIVIFIASATYFYFKNFYKKSTKKQDNTPNN